MTWRTWLAGRMRRWARWLDPPPPVPDLLKFEIDPSLPPGTFKIKHPRGGVDLFIAVDPGTKDDVVDAMTIGLREGEYHK